MDYQWDPKKSDLNNKKRGIDFADAVGIFEDEWVLAIKQEIVRTEQRFATVVSDFLGRRPIHGCGRIVRMAIKTIRAARSDRGRTLFKG